MSEPKHTPGPWEADESRAMTAINTADKHVAMVNISHQVSIAEHHANARLIAAAPEMLDALESLVSCISETRGSDAYLALIAARDAITKAKGQS